MRALTLMLLAGVLTPPVAAQAQGTIPIKEWEVPWEKSRPRDPAVGPDGRIWFVGQAGNYVARLTPTTGAFERFEIDPGTHPHNVIVDPAGNAWYAGNQNGMIGRIDGNTGTITRFPMPDSTVRDPHTMIFDGKGNLWFTAQQSNAVGRLTMATGTIELIKVPTPRARPYGIVLDPSGRPWIDLFGTNKLATVDPETMKLTEYPLPDERARPRRIALTSDGMVWYGDYSRGYVGRLDPKTGQVQEWAAPGERRSLPYAMTVDDQDRLWIVETGLQPNRLVGFDPKSEQFFGLTEIPSGGGTVRYMVFDPKTKAIWFGTDAGTIGRADVAKVSVPVS